MRLRALLLAAWSVGVLGAAAPGAVGRADVAQRSCDHRGATLLRTRLVRVYRTGRLIYACHRPTGRSTQLAATDAGGQLEYAGKHATAIRGSLLAYGVVADPDNMEGGLGRLIVVVRLPLREPAFDAGKTIRVSVLDGAQFDPGENPNAAIPRLVIAPNRALVYTACYGGDEPNHCFLGASGAFRNLHVVAVPYDSARHRYGAQVALDNGDGIDATSLRLSPSGRLVAWTNAGQRRIARVP